MRNNAVVAVLIACAASFTGALAACSSTTTETSQPGDSGPAETGTSDGGKDTSTSADPDTSTTADPDKACAALGTKNECGTCCIQNHAKGYKLFQDTLLACACTGTGADGGAPCATECAATLCKSPPVQADMTCSTCLQGSVDQGGDCQESVATACTADEDCLAEQKCVLPCTKKP